MNGDSPLGRKLDFGASLDASFADLSFATSNGNIESIWDDEPFDELITDPGDGDVDEEVCPLTHRLVTIY
jgi:hypothetical protein